MCELSREAAKEFIAKVRSRNGYISAEDRKKTPENVLESFDNIKQQLGASTDQYVNQQQFMQDAKVSAD